MSMKLIGYLLGTLVLAALLYFLFTSNHNWFGGGSDGMTSVILNTAKGVHAYEVEIADEKEERTLGLMNRDSLEEGKGMIFIYDQEIKPAFWMKNMEIPLDMIFFDKNMKVVDYFENVPACEQDPCPHYIPNTKSQYILEVNAGVAGDIELERGDIGELK